MQGKKERKAMLIKILLSLALLLTACNTTIKQANIRKQLSKKTITNIEREKQAYYVKTYESTKQYVLNIAEKMKGEK